MTVQRFLAGRLFVPPNDSSITAIPSAALVIDAAAEAVHYTGQVFLEAGSGSKTISSAGGKIHWRTSGAVTFANAGTTIRIGLQDVSTSASPTQGDGTYDVYADLVGGTDTIAASTAYATAMESGTKTIAHGDKITIVMGLTARGGSDSVGILYQNGGQGLDGLFPSLTTYLASTGGRAGGQLVVTLEFDDGTFGYIFGGSPVVGASAGTAVTFASNTGTADEYGNIFTFPCPVTVEGAWSITYPTSNAADYEVCLYADPLGTPVLLEAVPVDATQVSTSNSPRTHQVMFATAHNLSQNTAYALTARPTTTTTIGSYYHDYTAAGAAMAPLGQNLYSIRRLDNAGAFSDYNGGTAKTRRMTMGLILGGFEDVWGEARAQSMIGI